MKNDNNLQSVVKQLEAIENKLQKNPLDKEALLQKGILLYEPFQQTDKSIETFRFLINLDNTALDAYFWLAECLYDHNADYEAAELLLRQALTLNPHRADCHVLLASVLEGACSNRQVEEEFHLRKAIELEPSWIAPRRRLANLLYKQGNIDEAKAVLLESLEKLPHNIEVITDPIKAHYEAVITGRYSKSAKTRIIDFLQKIDERSALETKFNKS